MNEITEEQRHEARVKGIEDDKRTLAMWQEKISESIAAGDHMALAQAAKHYANIARHLEYISVNEAFYAGATWEQIGEQYGITKQAAQQRFGTYFKDRD